MQCYMQAKGKIMHIFSDWHERDLKINVCNNFLEEDDLGTLRIVFWYNF